MSLIMMVNIGNCAFKEFIIHVGSKFTYFTFQTIHIISQLFFSTSILFTTTWIKDIKILMSLQAVHLHVLKYWIAVFSSCPSFFLHVIKYWIAVFLSCPSFFLLTFLFRNCHYFLCYELRSKRSHMLQNKNSKPKSVLKSNYVSHEILCFTIY